MGEKDQQTLEKLAREWKGTPLLHQAIEIVRGIQNSPKHYSFKPENMGSYYLDTFISHDNPIASIQVLSQIPEYSDEKNQFAFRTLFENTSRRISIFTETPQVFLTNARLLENNTPQVTEFPLSTNRFFYTKTLELIPSDYENQKSIQKLVKQLSEVEVSPDTTTIEASLKDGQRGHIELLPEYQGRAS